MKALQIFIVVTMMREIRVPEQRRGVGRVCTYGEVVYNFWYSRMGFFIRTQIVSFLYRIATWLVQSMIFNLYLT